MIPYENVPRHKIVLHTQCSTEECQIVKHSGTVKKGRLLEGKLVDMF